MKSRSKDVLPRNVGIFGTVGSGKSNTAQVLIEEAAAGGWAVVVIDVEGEYIEMDEPVGVPDLEPVLARHGRKPQGIQDFDVIHPASCLSERPDSRPFTLRLADFDTPVVTELIHATMPERNALMDCVEHFQNRRAGHLVGISSIAALRGNPEAPAYGASKAFMSNYLQGLRHRFAKQRLPIVVTDVQPGFVDTAMAKADHKFWVASPQKAATQRQSRLSSESDEQVRQEWGVSLPVIPA